MVVGTALAVYSAYRGYQKYRDFQRMQSDFFRNTGRTVKYPHANGYDWRAYDSLAGSISDLSRAGSSMTTRYASRL